MLGRDKERLFPDCRREEKGGSLLKYLTAERSRWNEEVLFCFIFDVDKLLSYTGLPFKSQRCHSRWEFSETPHMTFSRLLWLGRDGGMFTWHLLMRERSNLCKKLLFNSKDQSLPTFRSVDLDLRCFPGHRAITQATKLFRNNSTSALKDKSAVGYVCDVI